MGGLCKAKGNLRKGSRPEPKTGSPPSKKGPKHKVGRSGGNLGHKEPKEGKARRKTIDGQTG